MGLLNYSTSISVKKSIMEIQKILVSHGATKILSDYDGNGNISSLSFAVPSPYGELHIRLPANSAPVLKILNRQKAVKKISIKVDEAQALRVAWKIIKDWIDAIMWTDEEYSKLAEMIKQRLSYELMSESLGKSTKAIRSRVYSMYLTENLDKVATMIGNGSWGTGRPERKITHRLLSAALRRLPRHWPRFDTCAVYTTPGIIRPYKHLCFMLVGLTQVSKRICTDLDGF